jgi:hypothetical protein
MSSKADYYRGQAKEWCLNAVLADNIDRRSHWLEAAERWLTFSRQEGVLTTPKLANGYQASRGNEVSRPVDLNT